MIASTAETLGIEAATPAQFVINLCASTSPMALSHPSSPELKKYTFFVSRQREEGRERFRLHMGYFASQQEAESLLEAVRDVYPAAWAGPAPASGASRRNRVARPVASAAIAAVAAVKPVDPPAASASPRAPEPVVARKPPAPVPVSAPAPALDTMSNVRDVLARLSEDAPAPVAAPERELTAVQTLSVLEQTPAPAPAPAPQVMPELEATHEPDVRVMTPEDTQTLTDIRLDQQNNEPQCFAVQLFWSVSPIDAAALPHLAIFDAYTLYNVEGNRQGRKWYGLRLGFFSDPHSATQVAHYVRSDYRSVAIVPVATRERDSAGGARTDRKAPAPRLGEVAAPLKPEATLSIDKESLEGFELLADDRPAPAKRDLDDAPAARTAVAASRPVPKLGPAKTAAPVKTAVAAKSNGAVPSKAAGRPTGKRVVVRKKPDVPLARTAPGAPTPLESTLEILGASTLTLDESREIINDSAVRQPVHKKPSGNRFSKLLSRLGGG